MAHLYANENFPLPVVEELRRLGHDVLTIQDAGRAARAVPDDEVLAFAVREQRAVITLNRKHFVQLHRTWSDHAGIIVRTFDRDFAAQARRIDVATAVESGLSGKLIRVNRE